MRYVSQAMTKHMLAGLQDAYAHKLGAVRKMERDIGRLRRELGTLEKAIQIFEPEWTGADIHPVHPKRSSRWGSRGQGMRAVIDVLKEAEGPLTVYEIATRALKRRGKAIPPYSEFRHITASLTGALNKRNGTDLICHGGSPRQWSLGAGTGAGSYPFCPSESKKI